MTSVAIPTSLFRLMAMRITGSSEPELVWDERAAGSWFSVGTRAFLFGSSRIFSCAGRVLSGVMRAIDCAGVKADPPRQPLPCRARNAHWDVDCPATQPGNCAQITCEGRSANGEDEKTGSAKSIMGRHSCDCPILEQRRSPHAFSRSFRCMDK